MEGNIKAKMQAQAQAAHAATTAMDDDIYDLVYAIRERYTRGTINNSRQVLELIDQWIERFERG